MQLPSSVQINTKNLVPVIESLLTQEAKKQFGESWRSAWVLIQSLTAKYMAGTVANMGWSLATTNSPRGRGRIQNVEILAEREKTHSRWLDSLDRKSWFLSFSKLVFAYFIILVLACELRGYSIYPGHEYGIGCFFTNISSKHHSKRGQSAPASNPPIACFSSWGQNSPLEDKIPSSGSWCLWSGQHTNPPEDTWCSGARDFTEGTSVGNWTIVLWRIHRWWPLGHFCNSRGNSGAISSSV